MVQVLRLTLANLLKYCPKKTDEVEKASNWSEQNNSAASEGSVDGNGSPKSPNKMSKDGSKSKGKMSPLKSPLVKRKGLSSLSLGEDSVGSPNNSTKMPKNKAITFLQSLNSSPSKLRESQDSESPYKPTKKRIEISRKLDLKGGLVKKFGPEEEAFIKQKEAAREVQLKLAAAFKGRFQSGKGKRRDSIPAQAKSPQIQTRSGSLQGTAIRNTIAQTTASSPLGVVFYSTKLQKKVKQYNRKDQKIDNSYGGCLIQLRDRKDPREKEERTEVREQIQENTVDFKWQVKEKKGDDKEHYFFEHDMFTTSQNKANRSRAEKLLEIRTMQKSKTNSKKVTKTIEIPITRSIIGLGQEHWDQERKHKMRVKRERLRSKLRPKRELEKDPNRSPLVAMRKKSVNQKTERSAPTKVIVPTQIFRTPAHPHESQENLGDVQQFNGPKNHQRNHDGPLKQLTSNNTWFISPCELDLEMFKEKPVKTNTKKKKKKRGLKRTNSEDSFDSVKTGMTGFSDMTKLTGATGMTGIASNLKGMAMAAKNAATYVDQITEQSEELRVDNELKGIDNRRMHVEIAHDNLVKDQNVFAKQLKQCLEKKIQNKERQTLASFLQKQKHNQQVEKFRKDKQRDYNDTLFDLQAKESTRVRSAVEQFETNTSKRMMLDITSDPESRDLANSTATAWISQKLQDSRKPKYQDVNTSFNYMSILTSHQTANNSPRVRENMIQDIEISAIRPTSSLNVPRNMQIRSMMTASHQQNEETSEEKTPSPRARPDMRKRNDFYYQTLNNSYVSYCPTLSTSTISSQNLFATRPLSKQIELMVKDAQQTWKAQAAPKMKRPTTTNEFKRKTYRDDLFSAQQPQEEFSVPGKQLRLKYFESKPHVDIHRIQVRQEWEGQYIPAFQYVREQSKETKEKRTTTGNLKK